LTNFYWPEKSDKDTNINDFLGKTKSSKKIEDKKIKVIQLWLSSILETHLLLFLHILANVLIARLYQYL
jgi:hypothetical protein